MINIRFFKLFILILLLSVFFLFFPNLIIAQESKFYNINLLYDKGKISLENIAVLPGDISKPSKEGDYRIELISLSGSSLFTDYFQIPLSIHGDEFDPKTGQFVAKIIKTDNAEIIVNIPYFPDGKAINIYDSQNTKVLEIPVIGFAQVTPTPSKPHETSVLDQPSVKILLITIVIGLVVFVTIFLFIKLRRSKMEPKQEITKDVS